jgi:hypothetical protein
MIKGEGLFLAYYDLWFVGYKVDDLFSILVRVTFLAGHWPYSNSHSILQKKREPFSFAGGEQNDEKENAPYLTEEFEAGVILVYQSSQSGFVAKG